MTAPTLNKETVSGGGSAVRPAPTRQVSQRLVVGILIIGLLLTAFSTWAAWRVDRNAEGRLLQVQTQQAAAVLSTAVLVIQQPLDTALNLQTAGGSSAGVAAFDRFMSATVGRDGGFVSAALWQRRGDGFVRLATVGDPPALPPGEEATTEFLDHALATPTAVVRKVVAGDQGHIVWAVADPTTGFVVYAERSIPSDRRSRSEDDAAFADLDYAIYIGEPTDADHLSTTNVEPSSLPLDGTTARVRVPFGDTSLVLVTSPSRHLGATLSQQLPWMLLITGLVLTALAALVASQLVRGRREAEGSTATITDLYERVDYLYEEQRALFVRLQRALLPQTNPQIPTFEVAAEYVAGALGIDIGGDWYSVIDTSEDEFAFVVGDVSGRGVDAVAVMAHARFTLRAYLVDGQTPSEALGKSSSQFDISEDGHLTTVLVGVGNWRTGAITVANAGHPLPLIVTDGGAEYVTMPVGPPLGTGVATYDSWTFTMPLGSTLLLYTDGLIERRTEDIDVGMQRLAETVAPLGRGPLDSLLTDVLAALRDDDASDDIAMLALRRVGG